MNPSEMTDEEIVTALIAIDAERDPLLAEQARRRTVAELPARIEDMQAAYVASLGRDAGDPYRQPTSALDAYRAGEIVTASDGVTYRSLHPANVWDPAVVGAGLLWEVVTDGPDPAF